MAWELINEIIDFAIEQDNYGTLGALQEQYGLTIDEAVKIISEKISQNP